MGNKASTSSPKQSPRQKFKELFIAEVPVQKVPVIRRNSGVSTVASTTTSTSTSRTNSPPLLQSSDVTVRRGSHKQRPRGVADMEIKSHCEKIKRIIGTSRLSQNEEISTANIILSSSDESVVYECLGSIVAIAQNSAPLEKSTLDDFLVTCDAVRRNQPKCANNVSLLMSQAKSFIEALVISIDNGTQGTSVNQSRSMDSSIPLSIPSTTSDAPKIHDHHRNDGVVLSQHGKITITSDLLQKIRQQYDTARVTGTQPSRNSPVLSQHGTMSTTIDFLQDIRHQYDTARVNDVVAPFPVVRSGPPPIQVTTVKSGPPPIQVTTVKSGPPPIQVTTVKSAPPPIQVTTVKSGPPPIQVMNVKSGPPPMQVTTVKSGPPPIKETIVNLR